MGRGFCRLCGIGFSWRPRRPSPMDAPPRIGLRPAAANRLSVLTFAAWALVPGGLSLYFRLQLLPGEQWGLGTLFLVFIPIWLACGLMFAFVRMSAAYPRRRVAGVFLACSLLGLALLFGTTRLSSLHFLNGPVERAFTRLDPAGQGTRVVPIESDRSLSGFGRFVREDPGRSTEARAALPLSADAPAEVILLDRRPVRMLEGCPPGVDLLLAAPVRDGWWYLFTDH